MPKMVRRPCGCTPTKRCLARAARRERLGLSMFSTTPRLTPVRQRQRRRRRSAAERRRYWSKRPMPKFNRQLADRMARRELERLS